MSAIKRFFKDLGLLLLVLWIIPTMITVIVYAIAALLSPTTARADGSPAPRLESPAPILLDFYSDWCSPCRSMAPMVDSLAQTGYAVQRINIDQQPELARQYGVSAIPCFVVLQKGREIDRVTGATTIERLKVKLQRKPAVKVEVRGQPHPAWRYERPSGYRAAVVRIYCQDDVRTRSIGSGTLVRWGERIVVLTVRHLVKDAKQIVIEFCTGRKYGARVLKVDATWDCAVLEVGPAEVDGTFGGVQPADLELGQDAMQREGNRLESCGYGPDGKLACNSGLFLGYRRSTQAADGRDDWMVISGHARGGDSGGGVFNARGRLVGVLWGTDGKEVVCVQAGRIHVLLDEAVTAYQQKSILERNPMPPRPGPLVPVVPPTCTPGCDCASEQTGLSRKPALPWRGGVEQRDKSQSEQLDKLIELERIRAARQNQPAIAETPKPPAEIKAEADEPSPLLAGLSVLAGVAAGFVIYFATQKT